MAATGLLIDFYRWRGHVIEPQRPMRILTRHATKVVPRARFLDEQGVAIDLTGLTVRYTLRDMQTGTAIVNRQDAALENQTTNTGQAYYALQAAHVAHSLDAWEQWEVDHGAGGTEAFPASTLGQWVKIVEDVDNV
jgi:hypothetical protein